MKKATEDTRTYLLVMKDDKNKKVTVPAAWKLTFGPICPGSKDGSYNSGGAVALRFYEGAKENQRAVFTGVLSFRDTSINVEELVTTVQEETLMKDTPEGKKAFVVRGEVSEWRNADEPHKPGKEFTALPRVVSEQ